METNSLGRAGAAFVRACKKIKWSFKDESRIASLEPVIKSLKHLQPRKGFVYETVLPLFAGYGDLCTPYARKESVPDLESIDDFERTPAFFRMMPKGYYEIWKKFSYKFNEDCIWELFLLSELPYHLPKFWHGGYESILYFLHTGDLDKVLESVYREQFEDTRLGFLHKNGYSKLQKLNQDASLLPKVTLVSDKEAVINFTGWNDWNGLLDVTVRVTRTPRSIRFHEKEIKRLVPYNCGICY